MYTAPHEIKQALQNSRRTLIATHVNPDGDALGSAVALAHIALKLGSEARMVLPPALPDFLAWLPLPAPCVSRLEELGTWMPDLLVFVDCADPPRAGQELAAVINKEAPAREWNGITVVNIDHHLSNKGFADLNWVEGESAATGQLAGILAEELGMPLKDGLGLAVYLALASDTGNFTYNNTSASCFAMASRIVGAGLDVAEFTNNYENNWNIQRMHLWGRLMSEISLHENGAVAMSIVPRAYLDEAGLGKAALEGFASWLRRLQGVRVGLFVREDAKDFCKVSLRSMGDVDVQAVAARFGGGGHMAAAGAEVSLPPEETARVLLAAIHEQLS